MEYTKRNLRTHLSNNQIEHGLRRLMDNLAGSAKYINSKIRSSIRGSAGSVNGYNEDQTRMDVFADAVIEERLNYETSFHVNELASEEKDTIVKGKSDGGRYSVTFDPLDGSSLIDVNLSIGTILGIHDGSLLGGKSGRESLVAAMYTVYGPETTLVYSAGQGVHEFVLNPEGEWILSREKVLMKEFGSIYSPGGLKAEWTPEHARFIEHLESDKYKLRYSGALVADANQILMKGGGIFSYPGTVKKPEGKLRLLFELQPLAMILEQAGGAATDGRTTILDKIPQAIDERSPIYLGSRKEVELVKEYLK